ncbi:MAG: hypothetical protein QOI29_1738, partial [Mycobacterium sp.]|nr:hypothetical protein [Mycobacterium sp.]
VPAVAGATGLPSFLLSVLKLRHPVASVATMPA